MDRMCEQTGPQFILSSERVWGNGVRTHVNSKGKIPFTGKKSPSEEDRTHNAASSRTVSLTHFQRAIPAPTGMTQQGKNGQRSPNVPLSRRNLYCWIPETEAGSSPCTGSLRRKTRVRSLICLLQGLRILKLTVRTAFVSVQLLL